jgi:hypothetical protein
MTQIVTEMPLYPEPYYEYRVALEDQARVVTFRWQDRTSSWHMDIKQDDLTPIVLGIKLVPYFPILADYQLQDKGLSGYFVLVDSGDFLSNQLNSSPKALQQFYRLFYVYEDED